MIEALIMGTELLTVSEVAARLKLNPQTVRRWIRRGTLPATKIGRKEWRIRADDLEQRLGEPGDIAATRAAAVDRILALRERLRGRTFDVDDWLRESRSQLEQRGAPRSR
jgi:excisionase family DNA binding protein